MGQTRFQTALNMIYPPRCLGCGQHVESDFGLCGSCWGETPFIGGTVCDGCGIPLPGRPDPEGVSCDSCIASPPPWGRARAALQYKGMARKLVLGLKHGDRQEVAMPSAKWMAGVTRSLVGENTLVAPVPLHWSRMLKRRYNQSALLAEALAEELGKAYCPDLLQRVRWTQSLDGFNREDRRALLKGAIRAHPKRRHRMAGRSVLLVDDVLTTGATLGACTRACLEAGAIHVNVVALARVTKDA